MLSEFIEALKSCPWYNRIYDTYPVIMLYLTGSRLYECTDDRSDYDMIAICDADEIEQNEPNICFTWKGKKVHWTWLPLKLYTEFPSAKALQNVGLSQFCHIRDEVIIYRNPNYEETIDALIANKDKICRVGTEHLATQFTLYIDDICELGDVDKRHYSKILSHLCRAYYDLSGQPIDMDFLRSIKRIRWQPVSQEYKYKAVECLRGLRKIIFGEEISQKP